MIFICVRYIFESEENREDFFEEIYAENIPDASRAEDGCMMYNYYFPEDSDNEILLIEKWENDCALKSHGESDTMKKLMVLKTKYVKETKIEKFVN